MHFGVGKRYHLGGILVGMNGSDDPGEYPGDGLWALSPSVDKISSISNQFVSIIIKINRLLPDQQDSLIN